MVNGARRGYYVSSCSAAEGAQDHRSREVGELRQLAAPAIEAGGGRFLARGTAAKAYEHGKMERTVLIEFDSVEQAAAVHDSAAYQEALVALGDGAMRDMRIVAGL